MPRKISSKQAKSRQTKSRAVHAPTVWQALNEPIAYPSEEFGRNVLVAAIFIMALAWLLPYWNAASENVALKNDYYAFRAEFPAPRVAGASVTALDQESRPEWYFALKTSAGSVNEFYHESVSGPFVEAAEELLDVSDPVQDAVTYYKPGVDAVWNAWVDLMADPY